MIARKYFDALLIGILLATAVPDRAAASTSKCASAPLMAGFSEFGQTGRMPASLRQFLGDAEAQEIEPYGAFDNAYYVGICWVSAWLITSPQGHVLIDTLYGDFTRQLLVNIRVLGFDPEDIKLVVATHGHFDHVGGMALLKKELAPGTRFAMTSEGWKEAAANAESNRRPFPMIKPDIVLADGQEISGGDVKIQAFETPGHTMGTTSYAYDVRDGSKTYRAFTVGGLGLNAIKGPEQVEAYIASVKRIRSFTKTGTKTGTGMDSRPVQVHLTTHGFSTSLPETSERLKARKPGEPHPLVDPEGFRRQLDQLQASAEERLELERKKN